MPILANLTVAAKFKLTQTLISYKLDLNIYICISNTKP